MPWINKDLCENKYNWWINGKSELHKLFHHHNKEVLNYLHLILYCFMCFYPCLNLSAVLGVGKSLRNEKIATISLYNDGIPFTKTTTVIYSCHKHNGRFIFHHYQILITWPRRTVISIRRLRHPMSNAELHKSACTHTPFPTHAHIRATSGEGRAPHTLITATSGAGGAPHTHIKVMSGASGATHTSRLCLVLVGLHTHTKVMSGAGGAPHTSRLRLVPAGLQYSSARAPQEHWTLVSSTMCLCRWLDGELVSGARSAHFAPCR